MGYSAKTCLRLFLVVVITAVSVHVLNLSSSLKGQVSKCPGYFYSIGTFFFCKCLLLLGDLRCWFRFVGYPLGSLGLSNSFALAAFSLLLAPSRCYMFAAKSNFLFTYCPGGGGATSQRRCHCAASRRCSTSHCAVPRHASTKSAPACYR